KAVIVVYVPGGSGPYIFDGRPYMRNGPTTIRMPREEYERRLLERLHATQRWENQPVPDEVTINDLDAEEIQTTLGNAIQLGRLESTIRRDTESILRGLELIHEGRLLNADDYLEITNPGTFHFGITPEKLTRPHESKPWNPIIANVFYRAGIVERWGSGTLNILDWCRENGNPPPASNRGPWSQVCPKSVPNDIFIALLETANNPVSIEALMKVAEQTNRTRFRKTILRSLLDAGLIEMTIPDKPRSSKQRYWLTEKGRHFLKEIRGGDDADE
ncbi:MAG TPA: ATP-binding protein, partial [Acidobacteriota bacterium]|nr:ATP-binding protein [Acidobacteriota bacterium]